MGVVEKLFLVFDGVPSQTEETLSFLWESERKQGDCAAAQAGLDGEPTTIPSWLHGVFSLRFSGAEIKSSPGSPLTAVAWVAGPEARSVGALPDQQVLEGLRLLPKIFPALRLPSGVSWDKVRLYRSKWGTDPCFRGSYSYPGVGASPETAAELARPLKAGEMGDRARLVLAGEALAPDCFGTAQGAILSGERAARLLAEEWGACV